MDAQSPRDLIVHLQDLPDPRQPNIVHSAANLVVMALVAIIADCDDWEQVADFCEHHRPWFEQYLDLPERGTPSHDTFDRFFGALDPVAFEVFFQNYTQDLARRKPEPGHSGGHSGGEAKLKPLAVDGKCVRRSFKDANRNSAVHLVSAWCGQQGITLGQIATDIKSNEITAMPRLLEMLDLRHRLVTIDAAGCQKSIAGLIVNKGGDYLLQIKANQPTLLARAKAGFENQPIQATARESFAGAHGRVEGRSLATVGSDDAGVDGSAWPGAKTIVRLRSVRVVGGRCHDEDRYYLTSVDPGGDPGCARELLDRCRGHWGIENKLHWVLDVAYREDESRIRMHHGAENMGRLRRLTKNIIKLAPSPKKKMSIKRKRMMYGRDLGRVLQVLLPDAVSEA